MADAQITVTGLTVTGAVAQNVLLWTVTIGNCLPYLAIDKFEVWAAAANDRSLATKVGETDAVQFTHAGLTIGAARYYWVRPRDVSGNLGDFFPLSSTAGVAGIPTSPGPGSVPPGDLDVDQLSDISGNFGTITTGLIQSPDGKMIIDLRTGFTKRIRIST